MAYGCFWLCSFERSWEGELRLTTKMRQNASAAADSYPLDEPAVLAAVWSETALSPANWLIWKRRTGKSNVGRPKETWAARCWTTSGESCTHRKAGSSESRHRDPSSHRAFQCLQA